MRQATVKAKAATAAKPRGQRVKGDLVPPNFVLKLMEYIGPTAAAKEIGTTPGTLHKARNAGVVSRPLEVAARGIWHEQGHQESMERVLAATADARTRDLSAAVLDPTSDSIVSFLVAVPGDKAEVMRSTIKAMGARIFVQQD